MQKISTKTRVCRKLVGPRKVLYKLATGPTNAEMGSEARYRYFSTWRSQESTNFHSINFLKGLTRVSEKGSLLVHDHIWASVNLLNLINKFQPITVRISQVGHLQPRRCHFLVV